MTGIHQFRPADSRERVTVCIGDMDEKLEERLASELDGYGPTNKTIAIMSLITLRGIFHPLRRY